MYIMRLYFIVKVCTWFSLRRSDTPAPTFTVVPCQVRMKRLDYDGCTVSRIRLGTIYTVSYSPDRGLEMSCLQEQVVEEKVSDRGQRAGHYDSASQRPLKF